MNSKGKECAVKGQKVLGFGGLGFQCDLLLIYSTSSHTDFAEGARMIAQTLAFLHSVIVLMSLDDGSSAQRSSGVGEAHLSPWQSSVTARGLQSFILLSAHKVTASHYSLGS